MQPCPRQAEVDRTILNVPESGWREDGTCSYCGSIAPDALFSAIASGYTLGPTDKRYKVYVDRPNPLAGQPSIRAAANFRPSDDYVQVTEETLAAMRAISRMTIGVGTWVQVGVEPALRTDKFYFQHLSPDEQRRFVDLLNAGAIRIGPPGRFYVLPFFVARP